ncbi:hypothetical protein V501_09579 [Pseudogymnoascus sp. VKM F-4519 (FW-2642)]|nr:hypothetical protein V501_09579 [Pseudogymnoascus sp. VKM F-4519 (FW-2642)]
MRHLLLSLALAFSNADMSLQNVLATRTTSSSGLSHNATPIPTPTEAPCSNNGYKLERRAGLYSTPRRICGWFSGTSVVAWQYNDAFATCFFNSDVKIVGNGVPFQTSCVDGAQLSTGSCTTCFGSVLECSSTASFCETYFYGSDYFAYGCGTESGISHILQTTPDGMTDPIAFLIYTGERGISIGVQYPSDYPSESRTIETSSYSLPSSTESTDSSASTPTSPLLDPSTTPNKEATSKSAPVGAIVGGVIGGVFLIALIVGIVLFLVIYSRRKKQNLAPPQHQAPQNGFGNPQVNQYPPMQQYPPPNNPEGGFVPQTNPNQHGFLPQQPANPELNPNIVNPQGFNQGAVSHIQPNQHTPPPQHPTNPELDSRLINPQGFN